jgi:Amt family ammonium transporter
VAITPCAGYIPLQTSPVVGSFVAILCYGVLFLKERYLKNFFPGFDDTLDVATGHGVAGALGTLCVGLLANTGSNPAGGNGVFYGGGFLLLGTLFMICACFCTLLICLCFWYLFLTFV